MADKVECPKCGDEYERLGQHWQYNDSHRPELAEQQQEIITGLMMGDGSLNRSDKNPYLKVKMITKEYLEELDEVFGCLSTGVRLFKTAEELAERNKNRGFSTTVNEENYHDLWYWQTRSLPELHEFDWYSGNDDKKVWSDNIKLTPTVLTHWYVGDGCWSCSESNNRLQIAATNEIKNTNKIDSYFEKVNLPTPSNYASGKDIVFTVEDSHTLWEYMDSPPSGFEYKFPEEYR